MKKKCLVCGSKFKDYLSLGSQPCADTFIKNKLKSETLKKYPLVVAFCKCAHLTATHPVPPHTRYEKYDYSYTSNNSPISRLHFKKIAHEICKKFNVKSNSLVIEAGSNDGSFLSEVKKVSNAIVLGIDPSKNISKIAKKKNINTYVDYFNNHNSKKIKKKYGTADVFYGANVFNHVDNNIDFLRGVYNILKEDGVLILEVPDLQSLIQKVGFDTIYHEHRHYYSEKSLFNILKKHKLFVFKIKKISYMSGSIRVYARKFPNNLNSLTLTQVNLTEFNTFKKKIHSIIQHIKTFVEINLLKNKKIYGIGAATKGNTLLNCCNFNSTKITAILEKSIHKINKYTPGSAIKIIHEDKIKNIEAAIILPWNISSYLKKKLLKNKNIPYISISKLVNNKKP